MKKNETLHTNAREEDRVVDLLRFSMGDSGATYEQLDGATDAGAETSAAQSLAIALRSPATKRSSNLNRFTRYSLHSLRRVFIFLFSPYEL